MLILVLSPFIPGEMTLSASTSGLRPATLTLRSEPVSANVDMPKDLPRQPTVRPLPATMR